MLNVVTESILLKTLRRTKIWLVLKLSIVDRKINV